MRVSSIAQDQDLQVTITREQLEEECADIFEKLEDPVEKALEEAALSKEEVDKEMISVEVWRAMGSKQQRA